LRKENECIQNRCVHIYVYDYKNGKRFYRFVPTRFVPILSKKDYLSKKYREISKKPKITSSDKSKINKMLEKSLIQCE